MSFHRRMQIRTILFALLLLSSHCISLTRDFPEKKNYLLEIPDPPPSQIRKQEMTVKIRRVIVSNKFQGKGFVYRKSESNFESDFYNEFFVPPKENLSEEIQKYLERKQIFGSVVSMNSRLEATHYIEVEVFSLFGDYRKLQAPHAVLELSFRVFDDRMGDYRRVFSREYKKRIPIEKDSPESLVAGWNLALSRILEEFCKDIQNL